MPICTLGIRMLICVEMPRSELVHEPSSTERSRVALGALCARTIEEYLTGYDESVIAPVRGEPLPIQE